MPTSEEIEALLQKEREREEKSRLVSKHEDPQEDQMEETQKNIRKWRYRENEPKNDYRKR